MPRGPAIPPRRRCYTRLEDDATQPEGDEKWQNVCFSTFFHIRNTGRGTMQPRPGGDVTPGRGTMLHRAGGRCSTGPARGIISEGMRKTECGRSGGTGVFLVGSWRRANGLIP